MTYNGPEDVILRSCIYVIFCSPCLLVLWYDDVLVYNYIQVCMILYLIMCHGIVKYFPFLNPPVPNPLLGRGGERVGEGCSEVGNI